MYFPEKEVKLKDGRIAVLRSAGPEDAETLLRYLRITAEETRFLLREPEEAVMTLEQEEAYLRTSADSPSSLMLLAFIDGEHAGNCGFTGYSKMRVRHCCDVGIALYQKFCNAGLGRIMMETIIDVARESGFEQMELQVVNGNDRAKHLYESLGFQTFGIRPHALKYKDGTYADETLMVKML